MLAVANPCTRIEDECSGRWRRVARRVCSARVRPSAPNRRRWETTWTHSKRRSWASSWMRITPPRPTGACQYAGDVGVTPTVLPCTMLPMSGSSCDRMLGSSLRPNGSEANSSEVAVGPELAPAARELLAPASARAPTGFGSPEVVIISHRTEGGTHPSSRRWRALARRVIETFQVSGMGYPSW